MKLDLNADVLLWLDSVRGDTSRQKYIVKILRNYMQQNETESKKGCNDQNYTDGVTKLISQV